MNNLRTLLLLLLFRCVLLSQNQVVLKPWVQAFGTDNGEELGVAVAGIKPTSNFSYNVTVSTGGITDLYSLHAISDTATKNIFLGRNIYTADLNGDGYTDVVFAKVSPVQADTVFIYWGTATGIDMQNPLVIPGEEQPADFSVKYVGDINNDGKADLILTDDFFHRISGKVYIYLNPVHSATPDITILGDSTIQGGLGTAVAVGDINHDGLKDLIVRGSRSSGGDTLQYDYVNIYYGSTGDSLLKFGLQMKTFPLSSSGLACFDVNGDGIDDLLWTTADSTTWINVHYGRPVFNTVPDLRLQDPGGVYFGEVIVNAGDMNGDGYDDIAVGCPDATNTAGYVFIYCGGPKIDGIFDAAVGASGIHQASRFGASIASVGDVNGDGLGDIIIGAPIYPSLRPYNDTEGYWGIFLGDSNITVTGVKENKIKVPQQFVLYDAYPNPFNPVTVISHIVIKVYDAIGKEVTILVNEEKQPGSYKTEFYGRSVASGTYFYTMTASVQGKNIFTQTKKLTLIK